MAFGENPEFAAINNIDRETRADNIKQISERVLPLHEKIAPILEKISINPDDFTDYDKASVEKDKAYVTQREADFAYEANQPVHGVEGLTKGDIKKLSDILEYQVIRGMNMDGWIPYCKAIKTSRYDDIANGIDTIVEFTPPGQVGHIGLGVDVSFSHNLQSKFERIKKEIDSYTDDPADDKNKLGQVKYFKSANSGITGRLNGLPRLVTALDIGVIEDISKSKSLKGHIAQHAVVTELEKQLGVFAEYAGDTNSKSLPNIQRAQKFIQTIASHLDSEEILKRSEYFKNAKVDEAIKRGLSIFS